jgi:hypothetical protein
MTLIWLEVPPNSALLGQTLPSALGGELHVIAPGDHLIGSTGGAGALIQAVIPGGATNVGNQSGRLPRYAEGSQACRNYSTLTKDLRIAAFQILAGFTVGLAIAFGTKPDDSGTLGNLVTGASIIMFIFAVSLFLVNTHYATAFLFIRDSLARLENGKGPWTAHQYARRGVRDECAYAAPFVALVLVAVLGLLAGATLLGSAEARARDTAQQQVKVARLFESATVNSLAFWTSIGTGIALIAWFVWMWSLSCRSRGGAW